MKGLTRLAPRIFNTPLMIERDKAEIILGVLAPKFLGQPLGPFEDDDPGDEGRDPCEGIAIIRVHGTLVHRSTGLDAWSGLTSYKSLRAQVDEALADDSVRGILLDVNSPGGEVAGCFDFVDALYQARGRKPIYAIADESAYSAAYAIASAADRLYLPRTAGVGSIGVLCVHRDVSGADKMNGFRYTTIFAGAHKNDYDPHQPLPADVVARTQAAVDKTYALFVDTVARNRGIKAEAVRKTEAGLFRGDEALAVRLADQVGTFDDVIADLSDAADAAGDETDFGVRARVYARAPAPQHQAAAEAVADDLPVPGAAGLHPGDAEGDIMREANTTGAPKAPEKPAAGAVTQPTANATQPPAPTAPAAAAVPAAQPGDNVVALDAARGEGRKEALAYVAEVNELCVIAGCPEKAAEFVGKSVPVAEVRKALADVRAAASEASAISAHNPGKPGAQGGDHGWDAAIAKATRPFGGFMTAGPAQRQ